MGEGMSKFVFAFRLAINPVVAVLSVLFWCVDFRGVGAIGASLERAMRVIGTPIENAFLSRSTSSVTYYGILRDTRYDTTLSDAIRFFGHIPLLYDGNCMYFSKRKRQNIKRSDSYTMHCYGLLFFCSTLLPATGIRCLSCGGAEMTRGSTN
jgi:hypothetical protein